LELVALQPVQLVSMETVPGAMAKLPFEGEAVTPPMAQPATRSKAGARSRAASRIGNLIGSRERGHDSSGLRLARNELLEICAPYGKIPTLFSMSPAKPGQFQTTRYSLLQHLIRERKAQNVTTRMPFPECLHQKQRGLLR
jgi:hypothetical protein